tara:strand:- start:27162 stop:28469 length:1308 start_codon:yes stop_codon:yes gene_type:complete
MIQLIKKYKKTSILLAVILTITSLTSYYFGALSYHYKFFPFNSKIKKVEEQISFIETAKNNLKLLEYNLPTYKKYGAIDNFKDKIIFVDNDGFFYLFDTKKNKSFVKIKSPILINNKKKFIKKYEDELGTVRLENLFGTRDILIETINGQNQIFLSSLDYNVQNDCYVISVYNSQIKDKDNEILINNWKKIFSSNPCLKTDLTPNDLFASSSSGGRIEKLDEFNILITLGDFYADGVNGPILSQKLDNDYGKIVQLNINTKQKKFFSVGHRNPQGLFVKKNKEIFSTEHGPEGGDELNLILENKNYGWPYETLGTDYNSKIWPLTKKNRIIDNYEKPLFSWGPGLGISNLIVYDSNYFFEWKDNILVTSLIGNKIIRLVYDKENNKIDYIEYIKLNHRIRDIIELKDGRIAILTDVLDANAFGSIPKLLILEKNL